MTHAIRRVKGDAARRRFFEAQQTSLGGLTQWRPSPTAWERALFDRDVNPLLQHLTLASFIAEDDGEVVGRVAAWVDARRPALGYFGFFDATSEAVGASLTTAAMQFCREQQCDRIRGPIDFWTICSVGVPHIGCDLPNTFALHHGSPHYAAGIEAVGLVRAAKIFMWQFSTHITPGPIVGLAKATLANDALKTTSFDAASDEHWEIVAELYRSCYQDDDWFVAMTSGELRAIAQQYVDPAVSFLMFVDDTPAAMSVGLRNVVESSVRIGDVIPPEPLQILLRPSRRPHAYRQWLFGVAPQFRGRALGHLGIAAHFLLCERARAAGLTHGEAAWTQAQDKRLNATFKLLGGRRDKVYYVYESEL